MGKMATRMKLAHYDLPPPDVLGDDLRGDRAAADRRPVPLRQPAAGVDRGRRRRPITDCGYARRRGDRRDHHRPWRQDRSPFQAVSCPTAERARSRRRWVPFTQTAGGRTGAPMPRPCSTPPFVQYRAPLVWTTLSLTIHADGPSKRAWSARRIPTALGLRRRGQARRQERPRRLQGVVTELLRQAHPVGRRGLAGAGHRGRDGCSSASCQDRSCAASKKPEIRRVKEGKHARGAGHAGNEMFLLLDGVLVVEVDGENLAELGPGAVFGERAVLEGGTRTATLVAVTACKVAAAAADDIDRDKLARGRQGHHARGASAASCVSTCCGVRGSTPAPGATSPRSAATLRASRWHTTMSPPRARARRGNRSARSLGVLAGEPFLARSCSGTSTGTTHRDCRSSRGRPGRPCRVLLPEQGVAPRSDRPVHGPAGLSGPGFRTARPWRSARSRGRAHHRGLRRVGARDPAQGRAHVRLPGQDARSSIAYLSDHGPAMDGEPGPDGFGPYHDAAMDLCRRRRPVDP